MNEHWNEGSSPPPKITSNTFFISAFLLLIIVVWTALFALPAPVEARLEDVSMQDLSDRDFTNTIYSNVYGWESYPEELYTPSDFASGDVITRPRAYDEVDYSSVQYATHRLRFTLPPDKTYGLLMQSADYSMRIYINGVDFNNVGVPGKTRETTIPRTLKRTYYFATQTGEADVIIQTANFVHREGAYPPKFYIGAATMIARKNDANLFMSCALFFCLVTASLYNFGLFLIDRKRKATLMFSVCCLLISFLNYKTLLDFFPNYNWFFAIRFEYINHYLIFAAFAFFLETLHPKLLRKAVVRVFYIIAGIYIVVTLVVAPKIFTLFLYGFEAAAVLTALYILVRLAMNLKNRKPQHVLTFVGTLVVALPGFFDILIKLQLFPIENTIGLESVTPIGMVFMVFCISLAVALDNAETERDYAKAQQEIADIRARLDALAKASPMGVTIHISDLGLSPRETEIAILLLGGKTRDEIGNLLFLSAGSVNTYCSRIYKKAGCSSRAEFARLLNYEVDT
ncbi:MAG: LuxR C-terminal-related transcriptional regulator [Oscillospiraceae bacterium]|nr:LuxR C-terminal-related transcriptional regulator [Oscillospiraceae bacterium]